MKNARTGKYACKYKELFIFNFPLKCLYLFKAKIIYPRVCNTSGNKMQSNNNTKKGEKTDYHNNIHEVL